MQEALDQFLFVEIIRGDLDLADGAHGAVERESLLLGRGDIVVRRAFAFVKLKSLENSFRLIRERYKRENCPTHGPSNRGLLRRQSGGR
jgi:hypothetical protein